MSILKILEQLGNDPSRLGKISILESNKENNLLKDVFYYALVPSISYYIKAIPKYTYSPTATPISLADFINELPQFYNRDVTGKAALTKLSLLLSKLLPADAVVAERIIKRDLRCGVSAKTINKIWPNLIPEWPVLLGVESADNLTFPALLQLKLDGTRGNAVFTDGVITFYSRAGNPMVFNGILESEIKQLFPNLNDVVLDGELVVRNPANKEIILPRKKGNGIINKAILGTISDDEASRVVFVVWDIIPLADFHQHSCSIPYSQRLSRLEELRPLCSAPLSPLAIVDTRVVNTVDEVTTAFENARLGNHEGVMLKLGDCLWSNSRSKQVRKFKDVLECDLVVVKWNEGTGKFSGKLGALTCESACGLLSVDVSGFTDLQRMEFEESYIVGKVITVRYNEILYSDEMHKKHSLFLPRFVEIRLDKVVPNSLSEISDIR